MQGSHQAMVSAPPRPPLCAPESPQETKAALSNLLVSTWPHALFRRRNEPLFNIIPSSAMSKEASGDWLKAVWTSASTVFSGFIKKRSQSTQNNQSYSLPHCSYHFGALPQDASEWRSTCSSRDVPAYKFLQNDINPIDLLITKRKVAFIACVTKGSSMWRSL